MSGLKRLLKADIIKLKSTKLIWMHVYIPIVGLIIFLSYFSYSEWESYSKVTSYFQVLCMTFPILIGIITSLVSEQEYVAGGFQNMRTYPGSKVLPLVSKYILFLLLGLLSTLLSVIGFYIGFYFIDPNSFPFTIYLASAFILIGSNMFGYIVHFFLSLRFSASISVGIGIVESLISALFLTSMGDGRWPFYPSAWGLRFIGSLQGRYLNPDRHVDSVLYQGIIISIIGTVIAFIIVIIWFSKWEGNRLEE